MANFLFKPEYLPQAAIGLGLVDGVENFSTYGAKDLTADVQADLTQSTGNIIPFPASAGEALEIVSDDITDTAVIKLVVLGPGGSRILLPLEVTLNGTTPVSLPGSISRINHAWTDDDAGFAGNVVIQQAGAGTVFATLTADGQQLNQGRYTIPVNTRAMLGSLIGTMQKSSGGSSSVIITIAFKLITQAKFRRPFGFGLERNGDTSIEFNNRHPDFVYGPTDIKVEALGTTNNNTAAAFFSGVIFDD